MTLICYGLQSTLDRKDERMLRTRDLSSSQQLVVWSARAWMSGFRMRRHVLPELQRAYDLAGIPDAALDIDALFGLISNGARVPLSFGATPCPFVHPAEATLINGLCAYQADLTTCASVILDRMLLPAAARQATVPAKRWAKALSRAGWSLDMITVDRMVSDSGQVQTADEDAADEAEAGTPPFDRLRVVARGGRTLH